MCQFKSALVLKDKQAKGGFKLCMVPWTESHSELCTIFKVKDGGRLSFARVEYSPESLEKTHLIETYKLKIDEERTPDWFDDEMKSAVTAKMRDYVKSIIVEGDVELLIGGQFIIAPNAKISSAHTMVINAICGGTVNAIWGGTVNEIRGGTVNEIWGGTVNAIWGGTVNEIRGGTVNEICGGTVNGIWGGTVNEIRRGTVNEIYEFFDGLIKKIYSGAIIVKDDRPQKS